MSEELEETINTTNTATKTSTKKSSNKEKELESKLEETTANLAKALELINQLSAKCDALSSERNVASTTYTQTPNITLNAPTNDVTLVYMSDSLGVVIGSNCQLNCTRFGEEFVLPRAQFDEIVGKYRSWFDAGILAVSSKNVDVAAAKGLKTDKEYNLDVNTLEKIGKMSVNELENMWNKTTEKSHRESIVTYCKKKFIEDKDEAYRNRAKIDLLNRLTNGGFQRESVELSGVDLKIRPTEM